MRVLVVNAGSSSLKLAALDTAASPERLLQARSLPAPGEQASEADLREAVEQDGPFDAVGHRVVHGGTRFVEPVVVDDDVMRALEALVDLAPLHQPKSLWGLRALRRALPDVPSVACFDTAFHAEIPEAAATYALPAEWRRRWSLRRFGFHGLSHAYAVRRTAELSGLDPGRARIITCHLGAGASLAAVRGGRCVDTTMGFTPLEGLVMATRSGSVDPGLLLWLEEHVGMPPAELAATLEHRSGLLGLTGSPDLRAVLDAERRGEPAAALAVEVYLHRLRAGVAAMAAALNGVDALAFTGGVGEAAPEIRRRAAEGLAFLGVALDPAANESGGADREIGAAGAPVRSFVLAAREDLEIARGVRRALGR